jgi:anti-anti-sigma regulatory factor
VAAPMTWTIAEGDGSLTMTLYGTLELAGVADLRTAVLKCLAEQPTALLLDLSKVVALDGVSAAVFTALVRQASIWPAIPLLLCAASPSVTETLTSGRFGRLPLEQSVAAGLASVAAGVANPSAVSDQLLPIVGAARHARNIATEACGRWALTQLIGPACLVASELVTNATEHAGTIMTLRVARRPRYLHISVRDGSPDVPVLRQPALTDPGGRGLKLIDTMVVHWGSMPCRDGKVVWATLAL